MFNLKVILGILLITFPISVSAQTSPNLLVNGDFSNGDAGWNFSVFAPAQATGSVINKEFAVSITNGGTESWHIQLIQSGFPIENGKKYSVSFEAYATAPRNIAIAIVKDWTGAWTGYHYQSFELSTTKQKYKLEFTMSAPTDQNAKFYFDLGGSTKNVYIDNVNIHAKSMTGKLQNGNFSDGDEYWLTWINPDASAYGSVQNGEYKMSISQGGSQTFSIQLMQTDLWIVEGKSYTVTFDAYAERSRSIIVSVQHQSEPWTIYHTQKVNLTTTRHTFSTSFTMNETTDLESRLVFEFGLSDADVYLDHIILSINKNIPQPPFKRGIGFSGWLEQFPPIPYMPFKRYTKEDFANAKSLGCDHIRLPLEIFDIMGPAPDYTIPPVFFSFLDQAVDWAEQLGLYLILDNHSFDGTISADQTNQLKAGWIQLANRYKNRSNLICYEIFNEPHGLSNETWYDMQRQLIETIRAIDYKHSLVVTTTMDDFRELQSIPVYDDINLIYTFHFYDPALFTGQGCYWDNPDRGNLRDIPYPYDADLMPDLLPEFFGTWVETIYNNYHLEGNDAWVQSRINTVIQFMNERRVPIWCGEFGCYEPNCGQQDRARWLNTVRTYFESNHISWSMWEYQYGFGIFESDRELFESDVTTSVIEALGLTVPPQKEFIFAPDTSGFIIYDDFLAQRVVHSSWFSGGEYDLNFLSRHNPVEGDYCISWTGADLYSFIGMYFPSLHDLTQLIQYGYMLNLWASCTTNNAKLNLRFIDTKTENPNDHPWTMCYILDNTKVNWDGTWQHVQIPLSAFTEQGAYDDGNWYTPQGEFDWSQVERFQIGTDYHDLDGVRLFLDDIRIVEPAADVQKPYSGAAVQFVLEQNYPNPFNPVTTIHYSLPQVSHVKLEIFNMLGQKVSTLIDANQEAGSHNVEWSITDDNKDKISSGIYFYSIEVVCVNHVYQAMRKMIIIK